MTKELILLLCQQGKDSLERTFAAVPDDKVAWQPAPGSRSALDAFGDAAQMFGFVSEMLESKGQTIPAIGPAWFAQQRAERGSWTREQALTHLETGFSRFKAALEPITDEELEVLVTLPMRGGTTAPLAVWVMMAYRALIARFAQINYIQTLYGDTDSH